MTIMTFVYKISLVGLSGAGKTTTLKAISPNSAYVFSESKRPITKEEARAWKVATGTKVDTTIVPCNFATLYIDEDNAIYEGDKSRDILSYNIALMIYDTCGQERFHQLTMTSSLESHGILFIIDSSIPTWDQKDNLNQMYSEVISYFNDVRIPIVIMLNKQDLWDRRDLEKQRGSDFSGKAEKFRKYINVYLPELRDCRIFNASALAVWGIQEPIKHLVKKIQERIEREVKAIA